MQNNTKNILPGIFTVNAEGKKIRFTRGNLFWDGNRFDLEKNQYDYPTTRNADHIGHFYWSKDAAVARDASYRDGSKTKADVLFAANGGAIEGYTVLTRAEWQYLMDHNMKSKDAVIIAGKKCSVLVPDGYAGSVASSYTAETWATAEAEGLVAIPYAGYYESGSFYDDWSNGNVWSASPDVSGAGYAYYAYFRSCGAHAGSINRDYGFSVRLVQEVIETEQPDGKENAIPETKHQRYNELLSDIADIIRKSIRKTEELTGERYLESMMASGNSVKYTLDAGDHLVVDVRGYHYPLFANNFISLEEIAMDADSFSVIFSIPPGSTRDTAIEFVKSHYDVSVDDAEELVGLWEEIISKKSVCQ